MTKGEACKVIFGAAPGRREKTCILLALWFSAYRVPPVLHPQYPTAGLMLEDLQMQITHVIQSKEANCIIQNEEANPVTQNKEANPVVQNEEANPVTQNKRPTL